MVSSREHNAGPTWRNKPSERTNHTTTKSVSHLPALLKLRNLFLKYGTFVGRHVYRLVKRRECCEWECSDRSERSIRVGVRSGGGVVWGMEHWCLYTMRTLRNKRVSRRGDGPSEPLESDPVVTREYTPFPFSELPDPSRADRSFLYLRKSTTLRLSLATTLAIRL